MTTKRLVSDELWAVVEPLLPTESPKPPGGRCPVPDRWFSPKTRRKEGKNWTKDRKDSEAGRPVTPDTYAMQSKAQR